MIQPPIFLKQVHGMLSVSLTLSATSHFAESIWTLQCATVPAIKQNHCKGVHAVPDSWIIDKGQQNETLLTLLIEGEGAESEIWSRQWRRQLPEVKAFQKYAEEKRYMVENLDVNGQEAKIAE